MSGFAHAHDLILLLNNAASGIDCSRSAKIIRKQLRDRLEHIDTPVKGLVKTYLHPFSVPQSVGDASHEALDINDLTVGRFGVSGEIYIDDISDPDALLELP